MAGPSRGALRVRGTVSCGQSHLDAFRAAERLVDGKTTRGRWEKKIPEKAKKKLM